MRKRSPYVIEKPQLKTNMTKGVEAAVTTVAWAVWLYFAMPVLTMVLWYLGVRLVLAEQLFGTHYLGLLSVVRIYAIVLLSMWLALSCWSLYNRRRFRGRDRRTFAPLATDEDLAAFFRVEVTAVKSARAARRVAVHFDGPEISLRT